MVRVLIICGYFCLIIINIKLSYAENLSKIKIQPADQPQWNYLISSSISSIMLQQLINNIKQHRKLRESYAVYIRGLLPNQNLPQTLNYWQQRLSSFMALNEIQQLNLQINPLIFQQVEVMFNQLQIEFNKQVSKPAPLQVPIVFYHHSKSSLIQLGNLQLETIMQGNPLHLIQNLKNIEEVDLIKQLQAKLAVVDLSTTVNDRAIDKSLQQIVIRHFKNWQQKSNNYNLSYPIDLAFNYPNELMIDSDNQDNYIVPQIKLFIINLPTVESLFAWLDNPQALCFNHPSQVVTLVQWPTQINQQQQQQFKQITNLEFPLQVYQQWQSLHQLYQQYCMQDLRLTPLTQINQLLPYLDPNQAGYFTIESAQVDKLQIQFKALQDK